MTAYLGYSYSTGLTEEEQIQIDKKTEKSRKEFSKGFVKGTALSLTVCSVYLLSRSAAHAADSNGPAPGPGVCPGPGDVCPSPGDTGAVAPRPRSKRGFAPLSDSTKGTFVGGASGVCLSAIKSGDFILGLCCSILLIFGGIVMTRAEH